MSGVLLSSYFWQKIRRAALCLVRRDVMHTSSRQIAASSGLVTSLPHLVPRRAESSLPTPDLL